MSRSTYRHQSGSRLEMTRSLLLTFLTLTGVFNLLLLGPAASAVPAKATQQIFPLDCVFEIVNDGTGTIIYHTPEECSKIPPPDPDPEPETPVDPVDPVDPVSPIPPITIPGVVTIIDNGTRIRVIQIPVSPSNGVTPSPASPSNTTINVAQTTATSNEITVEWNVPIGKKFKEFAVEARRVNALAWTRLATATENRRSTIITLEEGEYDVRVLGIPFDPNEEPSVLGVTRVIVQYTPVSTEPRTTDYSWVWILVALAAVIALWRVMAAKSKKRS